MARRIEQEYWIKDKGSGQLKKATGSINSSLKTVESTSKKVTSSISAQWKKLAGAIVGVFAVRELYDGFNIRNR